MSDSILTSTKKALSIAEADTSFDDDIIMYINSVLSILEQIGIGPEGGFEITDASATWTDFMGANPKLNKVQSYVYLRVRLLFDPPQAGYLIQMQTDQYKEMEQRLSTDYELINWVDPTATTEVDDELVLIIDGGSA